MSALPQVSAPTDDDDSLSALEKRLGRHHARRRLGLERDHEARVFGYGLNFFHPENWYAAHKLVSFGFRASGLYWRGARNALNIKLRRNTIRSTELPKAFDGFNILHLSDLHIDTNPRAMDRLIAILDHLRYEICVLTGDYRGGTAGPYKAVVEGLRRIRQHLKGDVFAVLGNHDTILMLPGMEAAGYRLLLNESVKVARSGQRIHLAGVDDAHYFRADNIEKASQDVPHDEFSILLSHTPEIYRHAAHADFNVMLCGHTHGGQICLPGGIPITLDSVLPRDKGLGAWKHENLIGYTSAGVGTSIVPLRFNCPPEVTLHELRCNLAQSTQNRS